MKGSGTVTNNVREPDSIHSYPHQAGWLQYAKKMQTFKAISYRAL